MLAVHGQITRPITLLGHIVFSFSLWLQGPSVGSLQWVDGFLKSSFGKFSVEGQVVNVLGLVAIGLLSPVLRSRSSYRQCINEQA